MKDNELNAATIIFCSNLFLQDAKESEVTEHFKQFGDIDYVSVVRDRHTKESKGFAYIKFHRMSHAAKAFEDCDRSEH